MPEEGYLPEVHPSHASSSAVLHPTPVGRVFTGTLVALGLYLGLRKVLSGWVFANEDDPTGWWLTAEGLATVFGLQGLAAFFGATLTGAGRQNGLTLGASVGGLCGGLFLAAEVLSGVPTGQVVLYLQPLILLVLGGIAGSLGSRVWASVPKLDMPAPATKTQSSIRLDAGPPVERDRPTAWLRVIVGAFIIVAGVGLAETARSRLEKATGGALHVESRGQGRFISWQIATLAIIGAGGMAAAGTGAGLRHGVLTGTLGAIGVVLSATSQGVLPPAGAFMVEKLYVPAPDAHDPTSLVVLALGVVATGLLGGWLGGSLFLPLAPLHMRKRRLRRPGD